MPLTPATVRVLAGTTVAAAWLAVCGCAATPTRSTHAPVPAAAITEPATHPELAGLEARAAVERKSPDAAAKSAPPPPGLSEANLASLTPAPVADRDRAIRPLREVTTDFAASRPTPADIPPVDPDIAEAATRRYAQGRQKLLEKDANGAIAELKVATELDPGSGEPWRELAEAYLATGSRIDAAAAFEKAVANGLEDPRALEVLGRAALERGENELAAKLLARAALSAPERSDPLLPVVLDVELSKALRGLGYLQASREALLQAAGRSPPITASSRYNDAYGAIYRRQRDLWEDVGDISLVLGETDEAIKAYARAQELPSLDGGDAGARLVYAAMKAGLPSEAALGVLRDVVHGGGRITPQQIALLRHIADHTAIGPDIAAALRTYGNALADAPPTVRAGFGIATASLLPAGEAQKALREQAAAAPGDARVLFALFSANQSEAVHEALGLAARFPDAAPRIAEALLRASVDPAATAAAMVKPAASPTDRLVWAYFDLFRGTTTRAAETAAALPGDPGSPPAFALAKVEIGLAAGKTGLAADGLATLERAAGPNAALSLARALAWFQRNRTALETLKPHLATLEGTSARINGLLLAADLAMSLGLGDDAEGWLFAAAKLDPFDDRAYTRLLGLYGVGGLRADSGRLNQTVRALRETCPDSRALRVARARELVRRSLLNQAEDEALRLADDDAADSAAVDTLVMIWKARAEREGPEAIARGKQWLDAQLVRRPGSPNLNAGLVTLLVSEGQNQEAAMRLRSAIAAGGPPDLSRMLEKVMRDHLNQAAEADAMAKARLEGRPLVVLEAIELAETLARAGDDPGAVAIVHGAVANDITLAQDQTVRLLVLASQMSERAIKQPDDARKAATAELFDLLIARDIKFSPELHERRLFVLAMWPGADSDQLLAAADDLAAQYPNLATAGYVRTSQALTQAKRGLVAQVFIAKAADRLKQPDLDVLTEWFRVTATTGTAAHGKAVIEASDRAGKLRDLVRRISGRAEVPQSGTTDLRAEAAYYLGNYFASEGRQDQADAAYELSLEYDPGHAWSCNNLGYSLLERGSELERAGRLLETAHKTLPDEASITDSLGWLRYKQGILDDERDPTGLVSRKGAVTLLQAAAMTDHGQNDATILDHVGDVMWLAGRPEEAKRYWELAERAAARTLAPAPAVRNTDPSEAAPQPSPAALQEARTLRDSAATKRRAAAAGQPVKVAPQIGNDNPAPRPVKPADVPDPEPTK